MTDFRENEIDFYTGEKFASVSFTSRKHVNKIKKLYASRPEEFLCYEENQDGSVWAKIPVNWVRITPSSKSYKMSDEHKAKLLAASKEYREKQARKQNASEKVSS